MINKSEILDLYFIKQYKQIDISKLLDVSSSSVNRIIMADERYLEEKKRRHDANRAKNKEKTINYINQTRNNKGCDIVYEGLKKLLEDDRRELSGGRKPICDRAYRDWNTSIYNYNEKSKSYVLKKGIIVGYDVPKRIEWSGM